MKRLILWIPGLIVAGIVLGVLTVCGSAYYYVEHNPNFCVSCHTMKEPFQKWKEGTHAMVNCHECHRQSKVDSLHQVWMYLTLRPDKVEHHPHLDHTVCARCHMNESQRWHDVEETAGHKIHFQKAGIECLDCHGVAIHNIAKPKNVCISCHDDKADMKNKMAFVHCTSCHNFLAQGKGMEGIWPTRENCLACHEKIQLGAAHVANTKENCITCHKPHVSKAN